MKFLLDANVIIGLQQDEAGLLARVRRHSPHDFGVPSVVMFELFYGAYKGTQTSGSLAAVDALPFERLDFNTDDARQAGEIRAALAAAGTPIGPMDVLIAGQARARDLVLITHNVREFGRVSGLKMEDWQA